MLSMIVRFSLLVNIYGASHPRLQSDCFPWYLNRPDHNCQLQTSQAKALRRTGRRVLVLVNIVHSELVFQ